ncbi:HAAS signaling domain-containing protein [Poseidonibacter lekithochrous]|uniref:HAAS signaling domain-containing protein n=1 Tax=Poseidonibacter lekithochrous TaxID=1904463 RepID=UPI000D36C5D5|nr:DUF1700 domain-containing protein [Poseidonibacter lekithochrous]
MTTNDYIKELKSHLSVLDNDKKKNIIQEIESYIEESDVDYSVLVERFGKPEELANNYLEDMPIKEEKVKVIWSKTKKIIISILVFITLALIVITLFIYNMTKDPFDYSTYSASTIDTKVDEPWLNIQNIDSLDIQQSKVVIYWTSKNQFQISCKGNTSEKRENILLIRQSECFIKMPKQHINIKSYQAKVVLVKPKKEVSLNTEQSKIQLDGNENSYKFDFKANQSDISGFKSNDKGILIDGTFYQSDVSKYEY